MKTVQLDSRLCVTHDIRAFADNENFVRTPNFCTLDAQEELVPWADVITCRQTNRIFSTTYPNQGRIRVGIPAIT